MGLTVIGILLTLERNRFIQDAINLIKKGKFSASSRMNRFLSNVNRIPITVKHLSGRYNLNEISDHQSRYLVQVIASTEVFDCNRDPVHVGEESIHARGG